MFFRFQEEIEEMPKKSRKRVKVSSDEEMEAKSKKRKTVADEKKVSIEIYIFFWHIPMHKLSDSHAQAFEWLYFFNTFKICTPITTHLLFYYLFTRNFFLKAIAFWLIWTIWKKFLCVVDRI